MYVLKQQFIAIYDCSIRLMYINMTALIKCLSAVIGYMHLFHLAWTEFAILTVCYARFMILAVHISINPLFCCSFVMQQ